MIPLILGRSINLLTPLLLMPIMLSSWGEDLFSDYLIVSGIGAVAAALGDLGMIGYAVNEVPVLAAKSSILEGHLLQKQILKLSILTALIVGFILVIILVVAGSSSLGISLDSATMAEAALYCYVSGIMLQLWSSLLGTFRAKNVVFKFYWIFAIYSTLNIMLSLVCLHAEIELLKFLRYIGLYNILFVAVLFRHYNVRLSIIEVFFPQQYDRELFGRILVPSLGHASLPIINTALNAGLVVWVTGVMSAGLIVDLTVIRTVINAVKVPSNFLFVDVANRIPQMFAKDAVEDARKYLMKRTILASIIGVSGVIFFFFYSDIILHYWMGREIKMTVLLFFITAIYIILGIGRSSLVVWFSAKNEIGKYVMVMCLAVLFLWTCLSIAGSSLESVFLCLTIFEGILFIYFSRRFVI